MSKESSLSLFLSSVLKTVSPSDGSGDDDLSLIDSSILAAKQYIERQALGGFSLIANGVAFHDVIAVKGQTVEIKLNLSRTQSLAGKAIKFVIGGNEQKSTPISSERDARIRFTPEQTGCLPLDYALITNRGLNIPSSDSKAKAYLHVLDKKPVICVDTELIFLEEEKLKEKLLTYKSKGIELIYVDFSRDERHDVIRHKIEEDHLPLGAIISLSTRIKRFEAFDADFKQSFLGLTLQRLRAKGVPVIGLLSDLKIEKSHTFPNIELLALSNRVNQDRLTRMQNAAKNFVARRNRSTDTKATNIDWWISELVPGKWIEGNTCSIQLDNQLARIELFDSIRSAKRSVDLQFYIFKECNFTKELAMLLAKAADRGVQIRLMVDALWSREQFLGTRNSFLKSIDSKKGITILAADALSISDDWDMSAIRERDHRKIAIIDGSVAYIGGRNAGDEYYYDWSETPIADWTDADDIPWLDAHVRLQGNAVKHIQNLFNDIWRRNKGKKLPLPKIAKVQHSTANPNSAKVKLVVHEGTLDANGLAAYEALICGARKKLILVNDFPVLDDIAEMLMQSVRRGVKVTFLTGNVLARRPDGSFFEGGKHRELFEYVVKARLGVLADAGIEVFEYQTDALDNIAVQGERVRPYVHAKLITADGRYTSIGSANLDATASYWEREANLFINDAKLVGSLDRKLLQMAKAGIRLDTSSTAWKKEAPQREVVARLWPDSYLT